MWGARCKMQGLGFKFSGEASHTYILILSQSKIYILLKKIKIVKKKEIKVQITKKVHHITTINPVKEKCHLYPLLWVFIGCFS